MTQPPTQDITGQILVQIRDEMREMRASFEGRFDALEARLESLDSRVEALVGRIDSIEKRMDVLERRMDALEKRMDAVEKQMARLSENMKSVHDEMGELTGIVRALESQVESLEGRHEDRIDALFVRFETIDKDLKKFVMVVNEAVLHYAEEMDTIRDRVGAAENKLGMTFSAD